VGGEDRVLFGGRLRGGGKAPTRRMGEGGTQGGTADPEIRGRPLEIGGRG